MRVSVKGLSKSFGNVEALRPIDLDIADREFVSLVGPSGSGKSTLVRLLAGLERPTAGTIEFGDERVEHLPANRRDIAMVFQNYALYPHLDVEGNIGFPLRMERVPREAVRARVREVAAMLEIEPLLKRKPRQLSGGQRQRVALGRAMVRKPALFLLDEPLSNLDTKLRVAMRTEIKRLHGLLNATFVYVTHDQAEALTLSDRIAVLSVGEIQQLGTPDEVYRAPANTFVADFVGSPPMTMLDAVVDGSGGRRRVAVGQAAIDLPTAFATLPLGPVRLGVRAEDVVVASERADGTWPALVSTREPLGSDLHLTLDVNGVIVRARVDPEFSVREGEPVWMRFRTSRLHFFDRETGVSLGSGTRRVQVGTGAR